MKISMSHFLVALTLLLLIKHTDAADWQRDALQATLRNVKLEARFQAGQLYQLTDRSTGQQLVSIDPKSLPTDLPLFGSTVRVDLNSFKVTQKVKAGAIETTYTGPDGLQWNLNWSLDSNGDLVLRSSARTASPVEEFRAFVSGCDIKQHALVWVHAYGVGQTANAPWEGTFLGDPIKDGSPMGFPHPLVALFQGAKSGWFIEGRDERVGPSSVLAKGSGDRATLGMIKRFPLTTTEPAMYEIRIRTYKDRWEEAVDPYVKWLEEGAGFVAIDKLPPERAWIGKLKTQAYISVGDYKGLEELAKRVNPRETLVGRQVEFLRHGMDHGYPDYSLTDDTIAWARRARELGFHVGMHFNSKSVSVMFPELVERFKPGFLVVGKDAEGKDVYDTIYKGKNTLYRVSASLKDWRDYLIEQIHFAVDAGIDVIYLDEAMSPGGKFVVDGVDGYQGMLLLMKELQERYPHVAIETEQFNTLTAKYGKLALSQMPLGHPLGGYILQRYVKVVPEGLMYSPTSTMLMDAFDVWGFMLPGADAMREDSWMQMAQAIHKYQLVADATMPRMQVTTYADHFTHGSVPVIKPPTGDQVHKLFGFRGANGVTAYLEKHANARGLVVYEPGQEPRWFGKRYYGIRSYTGPGVPAYFGFRQRIKDWLIYDNDKLLGLDPDETYWFDPSVKRSPTRFHLFKVPDNFAGVSDMESRTAPQEFIAEDRFFFMNIAGKGEIGAYVPPDYDAYLNGEKLIVDPKTNRATAKIDATKTGPTGLGYHIELTPDQTSQAAPKEKGPAQLLAFRKTDTRLEGLWTKLPWYGSIDNAKLIYDDKANGFGMQVGALGRIIGKVPQAKRVSIKGAYSMLADGVGAPGDGVVRINGREVLRLKHGEKPYKPTPFDLDISGYMGQDILLEFRADGPVRGASAAWIEPQFIVEQ